MGETLTKKFVNVCVMLALTVSAYAADNTGTNAMDFLALTHSVKSDSMGEAVTAISDSRGMSLNPSSIARAGGLEIQTHYLNYVESIRFANVAAVLPIRQTVFGVNVGMMDFGRQIRTTVSDKTGASGDTFLNKGTSIGVSAARSFSKLDVGMTVKNISQTLDSHVSSAVGLDAGLTYQVSSQLNVGSSLTNLTIKHTTEALLQKELRLGVGYKLSSNKLPLMTTLDLVSRLDNTIHFAGGAQYEITPVFFIRAGYNSATEIAPFSAGIGLNLPQVHIDFSYRPSRDFGDSYRVGVGVQF